MTRINATRLAIAAGIVALLLATASTADARRRGRHRYRPRKTFGIGLMLGDPTGLSAKYFMSGQTALAFGLGNAYHDHHYPNDFHYHGIHFHTDVLWHPVLLVRNPSIRLPFYLGIGGQFRAYEDGNGNDHSYLGFRVPFGIAIDFVRAPIDIFFELVPTWVFVGPGDDFYIGGALGFRIYF